MKALTTFSESRVPRRALGFTLIELAIGLMIVGLVAGLGISLLSAQQTQQAFSTTKAHQEQLRLAILSFVARNNRLPCPADPSVQSGGTNYGVEAATPGICTGAIAIPTAAPTAAKGRIPWVTLGIAQEVAVDGYGRYFSYFVTYAATNTTASTLTYLQGGISLYSASPVQPGLPKAATTQNQINACNTTPNDNSCNLLAVAALVSHGKNGYGAYTLGGGSTTLPFPASSPNVNEQENADLTDLALVDTGVVDPTEGGFDDMVVVWNPHDILNSLSFPGFIKSPRAVTNDRLLAARRSLISYVATNGLLQAPSGSNNYTVGTQSAITGQTAIPSTLIPSYPQAVPPACQSGSGPPTSCLPWSTLGLDATAAIDGWGSPFQYAVHTSIDSPGGLRLSTSTAVYKNAFVIVSAGPNRTFETSLADQPTPAGSDDIAVSVTIGELRGLLLQNGVVVP